MLAGDILLGRWDLDAVSAEDAILLEIAVEGMTGAMLVSCRLDSLKYLGNPCSNLAASRLALE